MAKTSRDAHRHIREWSQFFSDIKSATEAEAEAFLKRQRKRRYLKQSLRRLQARGFLIRKSGKIISSPKGLNYFRRLNLKEENKKEKTLWDGKWRLISFDVPIKENAKRHQLLNFLKEFDFYQLQKSVWVCPNKIGGEFWKVLIDYELDKYCKAMVVEIMEGDDDLRKHFRFVLNR